MYLVKFKPLYFESIPVVVNLTKINKIETSKTLETMICNCRI